MNNDSITALFLCVFNRQGVIKQSIPASRTQQYNTPHLIESYFTLTIFKFKLYLIVPVVILHMLSAISIVVDLVGNFREGN